MKKSSLKLYNVMFPIWMLFLFPQVWLIVIPVNFLIDSIVLFLSAKKICPEKTKEVYKKSILKVVLFGFLSDFVGVAILMSVFLADILFPGLNTFSDIMRAITLNPFENIFAFLWVAFAIFVSGIFIYLLNLKFSFKKFDLELAAEKRLSLLIAIFTAPYIFLLPTMWLYS